MSDTRVLYLVSCAAPPIRRIHAGIAKAQQAGWDVCLIVTPSAARWIVDDVPELEKITGRPIRVDYKLPHQSDVLPPPDAILVAPATFNTINKWATGISDTLALGLITEAIGLDLPVVTLPYLNRAQAAHPAFTRSVQVLRDGGVTVLLGDGGFIPHVPKHGNVDAYPWDTALTALT